MKKTFMAYSATMNSTQARMAYSPDCFESEEAHWQTNVTGERRNEECHGHLSACFFVSSISFKLMVADEGSITITIAIFA